MQQPQRPFTLRLKPAAMMLALALTSMSVMPDAYAQPVRGSSLYYRMGGGSPGGSANYRGQVAHNLGFGGNGRRGIRAQMDSQSGMIPHESM